MHENKLVYLKYGRTNYLYRESSEPNLKPITQFAGSYYRAIFSYFPLKKTVQVKSSITNKLAKINCLTFINHEFSM